MDRRRSTRSAQRIDSTRRSSKARTAAFYDSGRKRDSEGMVGGRDAGT